MALASPEAFSPLSQEDFSDGRMPSFVPEQATERLQGQVEIAGATVNYTYERPLEETTDEVPLLIVHGYTGIEPAYRRLRQEVAQSGKPAITIRPVRKQILRVGLHPKYLFHPEALSSRSAYGVMSDIQGRHDIDDVDVFDTAGHSMGGWVVSRLAERHPNKVRSASFVASAGLEDHSLYSLIRRLPDFMRQEVLPNIATLSEEGDVKTALEFLHYVLRDPLRTCGEGIGVSGCDIRPTLPRLGELGIKTAILNFASDRLTCNQTTEAEVGHLVDHCETHPRQDLGHLAPHVEPQLVAEKLTDIIHKITTK